MTEEKRMETMIAQEIQKEIVTEEKKMETMIAQENQNEALEVMDFLKTLDESELKEFLAFLQGAKFVKSQVTHVMKTA